MPTAPDAVLAIVSGGGSPTAPAAVLALVSGGGSPTAPAVVLAAVSGGGSPTSPSRVLALPGAVPVGMMVSGISSAWPANGYYPVAGTSNGRNFYQLGIYRMKWTGSAWIIEPDSGALVYFTSSENVAHPALVGTWTAVVGTGALVVLAVEATAPAAVLALVSGGGSPTAPAAVLALVSGGGSPTAPSAINPVYIPFTPSRPRPVLEPSSGWVGALTFGGDELTLDGETLAFDPL